SDDLLLSRPVLQSILDSQIELILRFRLDETITFVGKAFCEYVGKSRKELRGAKLSEHLSEKEARTLLSAVKALSSERRIHTAEVQIKDDEQNLDVWYEWVVQAVFDDDGTEIVEFQCTGTDITERKKAEKSLSSRLNELRILRR